MKDTTETHSASIKNQSSINTASFDISHFLPTNDLDRKLSEVFPEEGKESKLVQNAKEILGDNYTTEEIKELIASFEYLTNSWLEEYEQNIFQGKTLKEILQSV